MCIERFLASMVEVESCLLAEDALCNSPECLNCLIGEDVVRYSRLEGIFDRLAAFAIREAAGLALTTDSTEFPGSLIPATSISS
jgi:hypothetical protein